MNPFTRFLLAIMVGGAAIFVAGCAEQQSPNSPAQTTTVSNRPNLESTESAQAERARLDDIEEQSLATEQIARENELRHLARQSRESFILETQHSLSGAEQRIRQLNNKATRLDEDARQDFDDTVDRLKVAIQRVVDALAKVTDSDALDWENFRGDVDQAVDELESIPDPPRT
jgi:hypothetical protein